MLCFLLSEYHSDIDFSQGNQLTFEGFAVSPPYNSRFRYSIWRAIESNIISFGDVDTVRFISDGLEDGSSWNKSIQRHENSIIAGMQSNIAVAVFKKLHRKPVNWKWFHSDFIKIFLSFHHFISLQVHLEWSTLFIKFNQVTLMFHGHW